MVSFMDANESLIRYKQEYRNVAGKASILRGALRFVNRRIDFMNNAIDAKEDGAEVFLEELTEAKNARSRIQSALDKLSAEVYAASGLRASGFDV
jgi:hypothetical protein